MHYLIDGYNLLFRLLHDEKDLQSEREAIIYDLNKKISLIHLNASIVFDAAFQVGGEVVHTLMHLKFYILRRGIG